MKGLREFEIPFVGLKPGVHVYNYEVDKRFFGYFEESLISDCNVNVKLEFDKKETFFVLKFYIDGNVRTECDRCLEPFNKEIFGDYVCYVKFAEDPSKMADEDEVLYIGREETILDIAQLVYEYINLCLPMQRLGCNNPGLEPQCNKEVLNFLDNQNKKASSTNEGEIDPRWAALKKLKDN